jgi:hypothetical protein
MKFLFRSRYNFFDLLVVSYGATLVFQGHWAIAIPVIIVGAIISIIGEKAMY